MPGDKMRDYEALRAENNGLRQGITEFVAWFRDYYAK